MNFASIRALAVGLFVSLSATVPAIAQQVDLNFRTDPALVSTTAVRGGTVQVKEWTVRNSGAAASSGFTIGYFLSYDSTYSGDDLARGTQSSPGLAANGGTHNLPGMTINIPSSWRAGRSYVIVYIDSSEQIAESSNTNNRKALSFTVSGPDLDPAAPTISPNPAAAGATITVTGTARNIGDEAAGATTIGYYYSTNSSLDTNDRRIGSGSLGGLAAGATDTYTATLQVPSDATDGTRYIIVNLDDTGNLQEENEENNDAATALTVRSGPDLMISSGPSLSRTTAGAGDAVTVNAWTVKNQGTATTSGFTNGYYISTDADISRADTLLGTDSSPGLAPGGTNRQAGLQVTIPPRQPSGRYYIGVLVDSNGDVSETNEDNNDASDPITISSGPDLTGSGLSVTPTRTTPGGSVTISSWTVRNAGVDPAGRFDVGYFLSTNPNFDTADQPLGEETVDSLAAGASSTRPSRQVTIPPSTPTGAYYILGVVDFRSSVTETSETNNVESDNLTVATGPDLYIPSTLTATPSRVGPTGSFALSAFNVRNQGLDSADSSTVGFFLSTDTTYGSGDTPLGQASIPSLAPSASAQVPQRDFTLPGVREGTYYLIAVADSDQRISESSEDNNTARVRITVSSGPDLLITTMPSSPSTLAPGTSFSLGSYSVRNQGTAAAPAFEIGIYLSSDATVDSSDRRLGSNPIASLSAGGSTTVNGQQITVPADVQPGTYYLAVWADHLSAISESDEDNNAVRRQVRVSSCADSASIRLVQIDTANCPTTHVIVEVTNASGAPIENLTSPNFCVREDGQSRSFSVAPAATSGQPLTLVIAIDASNSLSESDLSAERSAARKLVDLLPPGNRAAVYSFSTTVTRLHDFSSDKASLKAAIDSLRSLADQTSLYDAIYEGVSALGGIGGRRAVVLMTDGRDNASNFSKTDAINIARSRGVPVFTIGFGSADQTELTDIAEQSGGRHYTSSAAALESIAATVGGVINGQYVITYTSGVADGNSHSLEICLNLNGCTQYARGSIRCGNTPGPGCSYTLSPSSRNVDASVQTGSISVQTTAACSWTASSDASWLRITNGLSGTGNGTISYSVDANSSSSSRTGRITAGGRTFTLSQSGASGPQPPPGGCSNNTTQVCLNQGRFAVSVNWKSFDGRTAQGRAVGLSNDTGYFWFFDSANVELVVKVLNGTPVNGRFWVFYGSLTNVEYRLRVTDTKNGVTKEYFNPLGTFGSVGDTEAFSSSEVAAQKAFAPETSATSMNLSNGRFRVEATWKDFSGRTGSGQAVQLTQDTGYFWFFDSSNVELVVKVLDATALNNRIWVYYGALSNVEYRIRITDTRTGLVKEYFNPAGRFASAGDTDAFPGGTAPPPPPPPPPSGCPNMNTTNVFITYAGANSGCSSNNGTSCVSSESIAFDAAAFNYPFSCATHTFQWSMGDGTARTGRNVSHTYAQAGTYQISLTISNGSQTITLRQSLPVSGPTPQASVDVRQIATFPRMAYSIIPAARTVSNKVYYFGGQVPGTEPYQGSNLVEVFDIASRTWSRPSVRLPYEILAYSTAAQYAADKFYFAPGYATGNSNGWGSRNRVVVVDVARGTSSENASFPDPYVWGIGTVEVNGRIYFLGGHTGGDTDDILLFDPATSSLTRVAQMKYPGNGIRAIYGADGWIYYWPTTMAYAQYRPDIQRFNPSTRAVEFMRAKLPYADYGPVHTLHVPSERTIYFFAGGQDPALHAYRYDTDTVTNTGLVVRGNFYGLPITQDAANPKRGYVLGVPGNANSTPPPIMEVTINR